MDIPTLQQWPIEPRHDLIAAVAEGVHAHVETLQSRGIEFYGYALLPGEFYDIHSLVAATNTEASIKVPKTDKMYRYYRYGVDEWAHWDHDGFTTANALLVKANEQFKTMHKKEKGDFRMDSFEVAHANGLLDSVVRGLLAAKNNGAFKSIDPFLVVWISDSGHTIMADSARQLNSPKVAQEFLREFG